MKKKIIELWPTSFLPLTFVFGNLVLFVFFYLGLCYVENPVRQYGFIILSCSFAIFSGISMISIYKEILLRKKTVLILIGIIFFYIIEFGISIYKYGLEERILNYIEKFVVFSLPAFFAGIYAGIRRTDKYFFNVMEKISLLMFPAAIIYFNGVIFNCSGFAHSRGLGFFNYMDVAYAFMPFLLVHFYQFSKNATFCIKIKKISPCVSRAFLIVVYWVDIIATGTRGCYVCVIVFCIALVTMKIIRKEKVRLAILASTFVVGLLLFNMFVYSPPGISAGVGRVTIVLDGLEEGKLVTSYAEDEDIEKYIDDLVSKDATKQIANSSDNPANNETIEIGNRGTLYRLAIKEFQKAPVSGMYAGRFTVKYGLYPHNVILELLCETGAIASFLYLIVVVFVVVKLTMISLIDESVFGILLFLIAYAVQANISGSFWNCSVLLCALGYGLCLPRVKDLKSIDGRYFKFET